MKSVQTICWTNILNQEGEMIVLSLFCGQVVTWSPHIIGQFIVKVDNKMDGLSLVCIKETPLISNM